MPLLAKNLELQSTRLHSPNIQAVHGLNPRNLEVKLIDPKNLPNLIFLLLLPEEKASIRIHRSPRAPYIPYRSQHSALDNKSGLYDFEIDERLYWSDIRLTDWT